MKKPLIKKIFFALVAVLLLLQLWRPEQNSGDTGADIAAGFSVNPEVSAMLKTACYDCHSNNTVYPWYASVQPLAFWLANHINEGKEHLNFSEFMNYPPYRQFHKLEEIDEVLAEDEMPLKSYTLVHRNAVLKQADKDLLIQWSKNMRDSLRAQYPPEQLEKPGK